MRNRINENKMVFFFKNLETKNQICLGNNTCYKIGRRSDNDIIIFERTVSKYHGELKIKNGLAVIKDFNSKRGTFVNKEQVEKMKLKNWDIINFGLVKRNYQFLELTWSTCIINHRDLDELKKTLNKCEVTYSMSMRKDICTHVTADEIILNQESLLALLYRKPFVTFKFWYQLLQNIENMDPCPDVKDYVPPLCRELREKNVEWSRNINGFFLFENKFFVFFDDISKKKVFELVKACAGTVLEWSKIGIEIKSQITVACNPNYLVIYTDNVERLPQIMTVQKCIKTAGLRLIKEEEIFWAVLLGSTERYCNPFYRELVLGSETGSESFITAIDSEKDSENSHKTVCTATKKKGLPTWLSLASKNHPTQSVSKSNKDVSEGNIDIENKKPRIRVRSKNQINLLEKLSGDESLTKNSQYLTAIEDDIQEKSGRKCGDPKFETSIPSTSKGAAKRKRIENETEDSKHRSLWASLPSNTQDASSPQRKTHYFKRLGKNDLLSSSSSTSPSEGLGDKLESKHEKEIPARFLTKRSLRIRKAGSSVKDPFLTTDSEDSEVDSAPSTSRRRRVRRRKRPF